MIWAWVGLFYFNAFSSLDLEPMLSSGLATLPLVLVWMVYLLRGRSVAVPQADRQILK
jgi:hypothetical protein